MTQDQTPKTVEQVVRSHSINVLRECAVQTHTDWERYVRKSEKAAITEVEQLLKEARIAEIQYWIDDFTETHTQYIATTKSGLTLAPTSTEYYIKLSSLTDRLESLKEGEKE